MKAQGKGSSSLTRPRFIDEVYLNRRDALARKSGARPRRGSKEMLSVSCDGALLLPPAPERLIQLHEC